MDYTMYLYALYFIVLGLWWSIQTAKVYYVCRQKKLDFVSNTSYSCCQACAKVPVEPIMRLCICLLAVGLSVAAAYNNELHVVIHYEYLHQATIFAFFAVISIADIILKNRKCFLPDINYLCLVITFGVQGVLFRFQATNRSEDVKTVFSLLTITSVLCSILFILEMRSRSMVLFPILRSLCVMVLGSWFAHSSLILSNPVSVFEEANHSRVLILSMYFSWHCAINLVIVLCVWILVWKCNNDHNCPCMPNVTEYDSDMLYLENRTHFDFRVFDRFDAEVD